MRHYFNYDANRRYQHSATNGHGDPYQHARAQAWLAASFGRITRVIAAARQHIWPALNTYQGAHNVVPAPGEMFSFNAALWRATSAPTLEIICNHQAYTHR